VSLWRRARHRRDPNIDLARQIAGLPPRTHYRDVGAGIATLAALLVMFLGVLAWRLDLVGADRLAAPSRLWRPPVSDSIKPGPAPVPSRGLARS
jgi:hypothetical protein